MRKWFWNWCPGNISHIISAPMCYEVNYVFLRTAVEWYPFGPCRIAYKMMLNSMHCHHRVGLEISAKALLPLSQIPPECARSYCMPFHTSRSTLSCNIWKQTNKHINKNNVVIEANRQTSYLLSIAALLAAVANITVDYGTVHVIFIQKKGFNARRESLFTVCWLFFKQVLRKWIDCTW